MNNHKATFEQWNNVEISAKVRLGVLSPCLLELRARVEALEAQASNYPETPDSSTPPPVATDEELDKLWNEQYDFFNLYEEARCFARAVLERWGHR
jgi:hypothetical protein